jgi:hypothetical protein
VLGVFSAGYIAVAVSVAARTMTLAIVLAVLGVLSVVCAVVVIALVIQEQTQWKYYWRKYLGEAAVYALKRRNAEAFSGVMLAKAEVEAAPILPLPAAIGFYATVFTVTQVGLTWLSQHVNWL